jgi:hypothetical protein
MMHFLSEPMAGRQFAYGAGGFKFVYHDGEPNRCPGCGRRQWFVGRVTAECAFCETALPLEHINGFGYAPRFETGRLAGEWPGELRPIA